MQSPPDIVVLFINLCRLIVWLVILAAVLLFAYCALRGLDMLFDHVNRRWFYDDRDYWLIITALAVLAAGIGFNLLSRICWRRNRHQIMEQRQLQTIYQRNQRR